MSIFSIIVKKRRILLVLSKEGGKLERVRKSLYGFDEKKEQREVFRP